MGDSRALYSFDNCGSTFCSPQSLRAADIICDSPVNSPLSQKYSAMKAKKCSDLSEPFSVPGTQHKNRARVSCPTERALNSVPHKHRAGFRAGRSRRST
jgi:hypothetical protein